MPDWQKGVVDGKFRAIPDVSFDADGEKSPLRYFLTANLIANPSFDPKKFINDVVGKELLLYIINGGDIHKIDQSKVFQLIGIGTLSGGKFIPDFGQDSNTPLIVAKNYNQYTSTGGGTSLSAPLAVGMWARMQSKANGRLPFAPAILYGLAAQAGGKQGTAINSPVVHDVTSGSNGSIWGGGYKAGPGWDNVTGWGSFDIEALSNIDPKLVAPYLIPPGNLN
jgi:hypothetical protein